MGGGEPPCRSGVRHWFLSHSCCFLSSYSLRHFRFSQVEAMTFQMSWMLTQSVIMQMKHLGGVSSSPWLAVWFPLSQITGTRVVTVSYLLLISLNSDICSTLALFCATVSTGMAVLANSLHFDSFWNRSAFVFAPFPHLVPAKPKSLAPVGIFSQEHHQRICWQSCGQVWLFPPDLTLGLFSRRKCYINQV